MKVVTTALPEVLILEPVIHADDRGWFMESWAEVRFNAALAAVGERPRRFVQDNHSCSRAGVLRGLHYQLPPHPQAKLVRVVSGSVFDVAVDIRRGSQTFGHWVGDVLSAANHLQRWIPEGFAHGFLALEDDTHVLYKTTAGYARAYERAIRWNDPKLAIAWPNIGRGPILSTRDAAAPPLDDAEV